MRRARWIAPWKDSETKPAIYHCISRVVERRFAFGVEEKERFRTLMRMMYCKGIAKGQTLCGKNLLEVFG